MQEILKDLYLIDPSLKKDEEKIISIIEDLIKNEPNIELNQDFVAKLKEEIFLEVEKMENEKKVNLFSWQNIIYVSSSAVFVIILSFFVFSNFLLPTKETETPLIIALNERAFGDLIISSKESRSGQDVSLSEGDNMVLGLGSASDLVEVSGEFSIIPYPIEQNNYVYVYNGDFLDNLDLSSVSNLVYKRDVNNNFARVFANSIKSVTGLPLNLNSFNQAELQHFNIIENKEYGYSVAVNLINNSISIYSYWQNWPQPYRDCYDEFCIESLRLNEGDMLSDSQLVLIANNFINNHNVNLNNYGPAEIINDHFLIKSSENNYYPEQISLVYPLIINDQHVYSSHGGKDGLQLSINIREKRVSSLSNLNFSNIKSSSYPLISDTKKINELLKRGGLYPDYYRSQENIIEVELVDPKIALVKTWLASSDRGESVEIYIPSIIFQIKERPSEYFNRQNVIIPLVKEIFEDSLEKINYHIDNYVDILPIPRIIDEPQIERDLPEVEDNDLFRIQPIE